MTASILTNSGKWIDILNPETELICIHDIASALSKLCRFGGHCNEFYSVAEHSIHVSRLAHQLSGGDPDSTKWGLLHDASEAYVVDIPKPIKGQLPEYMAIEEGIQRAVALKFNLSTEIPEATHLADQEMLAVELRAYMPSQPEHLLPALRNLSRMPMLGSPLPPALAMEAFLAEAQLLGII